MDAAIDDVVLENEIESGWAELQASADSEVVSPAESESLMDITDDTTAEAVQENESTELDRASEETVLGHEHDDSPINLEFVEGHMRHSGSNAGPVTFKDMPLVLGRDTFVKYDAHKKRKLVSRSHALIEAQLNPTTKKVDYYLRDTSVNGTFLGANRLAPDGPPAKLEHGDVIGILTSHSSPLETYSPYGDYFTVTLGLRWLRPDTEPEKIDPEVTQEHHIPIMSRLHSEYAPGTFVDQDFSESEDEEIRNTQKTDTTLRSGSSRSTRSISAKGSVSAHSTPARIRVTGSHAAQTSPRRRKITRTPRHGSTSSKHASKSGNDTDDTDGDDEREEGGSKRGKVKVDAKQRKPIIAISRPVFDESTYTPSARTPKARAGEYWTLEDGSSTTRRGTPLRSLTFPAPSSDASPSTPAPGTYWNLTPGSRDRKRLRQHLTSESADELEPAKKFRAEELGQSSNLQD